MVQGHRRLVAIAVAALLALGACGNSGSESSDTTTPEPGEPIEDDRDVEADRHTFVEVDAPGVTDDEIRFGSIATITSNPLGTNLGQAYNEGIEAYFAFRNDEGGIFGRDLVLASKDDDMVGQNLPMAQALAANDDVFGAFVATLLFGGADALEEGGVPTFAWGIHDELVGKRFLFGHIAPLCPDCVLRSWPYLASEAGAQKVAVLAYNNSETSIRCAAGIRNSIEAYGPELGDMEVVFFDDNLSFGLTGGIAPQVSAMKRADVDYVTACMDLNGMKTLAEELDKQGMDDVVLQHPNSYDEAFVKANAEVFEGDFVTTTFTPYEAEVDSELQRALFEWTDELGFQRYELTMIGWLNAHQAYTALLEAGPEFDRTSVVDGLRSVTNYSADNLVSSINWFTQRGDPEDYELECTVSVKIVDGEFELATGEPGKPWACWERQAEGFGTPVFVGDFSDVDAILASAEGE